MCELPSYNGPQASLLSIFSSTSAPAGFVRLTTLFFLFPTGADVKRTGTITPISPCHDGCAAQFPSSQ